MIIANIQDWNLLSYLFKNIFFFKCMITRTVNIVLGVYIGILVISTTTGHGGSVVSALASQAKGRGFISQL